MSRNSPRLPPSDAVSSRDELLNPVLAGLRDIEAPTGIERRIVQKMEDRVFSSSLRSCRKPVWLAGATTWALAVRWVPSCRQLGGLGLTALAISLLALHSHRTPPNTAAYQPPRAGSSPLQASSQPRAAVGEASARALPRAAAWRPPAPPIRKSEIALLHPGGAKRPATGGPTPTAVAQTGSASLALSEMRAPSCPPPEMPLTEQERLLRRIVHRGDPAELAELDPAIRNADTAREKADFQAFFEPPQPKPNP